MDDRTDRAPVAKKSDREIAATPRKRFRLEKLEERVTPAGHYNPHTKWVGSDPVGSNSDSSTSGSVGY